MQSLGTNPAAIGLQAALRRERRRRVRHKVQLPAYASLGGNLTAAALDLSEIVNLSEEGMAIQTSSPLAVDQKATFVLDLPETNASIRADGRVVWAAPTGRVGIKFAELPPELNFELRKWLFANAVAAWVNRSSEPALIAKVAQQNVSQVRAGAIEAEPFQPRARPDHTAILTGLEAVKREVEALGTDLDAALRLIALRAQAFTHAEGAAIALSQSEDMVCRASAGPSAPPVGAHFKIGSGFSGECIRTGSLLRCEDSETDSRVDRESCRALAIRSMIAAPIRWEVSIIGLIEVFSSQAHAFAAEAELVLVRLSEIVAEAVHRAGSLDDDPGVKLGNLDDEFPSEELPDLSPPEHSRSRNVLLFAAGLTIVLVILWLIGTWGSSGSSDTRPSASSQSKAGPAPVSATPIAAENLQSLRQLANQGDPTAQFALGARYATGEEVPQDYAEAVQWFKKAAEQGQVAAQATLGAYYWAGRGVPVDLSQAYFWSFLAEAGGDEASRSRVALLTSRLSRGQVIAAQREANEWYKRHQLAADSSQ
ncbi:MAG TPA: PilZ domain-containing protein [Terriglobales bacterium]|nr:PilZ domain-containing protein [Terriglobales bacterium]